MQGDVDDANVTSSALGGLSDEQTERLGEVLDRYLAGLEAGEPLAWERLLGEHADLREPLRQYLEKLDELHNFSAGFAPQLAGASSGAGLRSGENALFGQATRADRSQPTPLVPDSGAPYRRSALTTCDPLPPEFLDGHLASEPAGSAARRLGDFELLRVVGRGGMGIVYEAEQLSLRRRVALKLLPLTSLLDSRQIARFKNEAQAAAALQHPNIVPVYAVGSYQGVHYYAMRLIDGQPLDAIIAALRIRRSREKSPDAPTPSGQPTKHDEPAAGQPAAGQPAAGQSIATGEEDVSAAEGWDHPTDVRRVVRLGIEAALALAAAHEEGIVHRDVKPSNLLVDHSGKLWITDFGLARRTSDHSLTATGDVLGTLRYMSPEQASGRGALVDARSDIYSLGVTLYELLTLVPAVVGASSPGLLRAIEQHAPLSLRYYRSDLPRDLVTVLETAMAKDREERYLTAQLFADDLVRVLEGRPTLAKPPSVVTRCAKWAARHHRIVSLVAVAVLIASVGLGVSVGMIADRSALAKRSRSLAKVAWYSSRQSAESSRLETAERLEGVPGTEGIRQRLLVDQLDYYQQFIKEFAAERSARADVATALLRSGALHRELDQPHAAEASLQQAYTLYQALVAAEPDNLSYRKDWAACADRLGHVRARLGGTRDAEELMREAVRSQTTLLEDHPDRSDLSADLAESRNHLALLLAGTGKRDEAEQLLHAARAQLVQLNIDAPHDWKYQTLLADTYRNLATVVGSRDPSATVEWYEQALEAQQKVLEAWGDGRPRGRQVALAYSSLGQAHVHAGQPNIALDAYKNAIQIQRQLIAIAPSYRAYVRDLSVSLNNLGLAQMKRGQLKEAEASFREAIAWQARLVEQAPADARAAHDLGGTYNNLATLLQSFPELQAIDTAFEQAIAYQRQAQQMAPEVEKYREFLDNHLQNYSAWLRKSHRDERALAAALERRILWSGNAHKLVLIASDLAEVALDAGDSNRQGVAQHYADAARETLGLAQNAGLDKSRGLTIQQLLSQQPFSSLAKIKSPTD